MTINEPTFFTVSEASKLLHMTTPNLKVVIKQLLKENFSFTYTSSTQFCAGLTWEEIELLHTIQMYRERKYSTAQSIRLTLGTDPKQKQILQTFTTHPFRQHDLQNYLGNPVSSTLFSRKKQLTQHGYTFSEHKQPAIYTEEDLILFKATELQIKNGDKPQELIPSLLTKTKEELLEIVGEPPVLPEHNSISLEDAKLLSRFRTQKEKELAEYYTGMQKQNTTT